MTLRELKIGESAVVTQLGGEGALRQHFLDMGMIPGAEVTVQKMAPMGDPMELKIHGYELTLRLADAEKIQVEKISEKIGKPVECVLALEVDFDVLKERITGRRVCPKCGAIYHIHNFPSKVEGICDVCGSELKQRSDDTVEKLTQRMEEYENSTKPVIDFFEDKNVVKHLNAAEKPEIVFGKIQEALNQLD